MGGKCCAMCKDTENAPAMTKLVTSIDEDLPVVSNSPIPETYKTLKPKMAGCQAMALATYQFGLIPLVNQVDLTDSFVWTFHHALSILALLQICGIHVTSANTFQEAYEDTSLFGPNHSTEDYVPVDPSCNFDSSHEEDYIPVDSPESLSSHPGGGNM